MLAVEMRRIPPFQDQAICATFLMIARDHVKYLNLLA